ncbi:MAG: hypothetical protein WDA18_09665 [Candidatus Ratteibacteria bacterium]
MKFQLLTNYFIMRLGMPIRDMKISPSKTTVIISIVPFNENIIIEFTPRNEELNVIIKFRDIARGMLYIKDDENLGNAVKGALKIIAGIAAIVEEEKNLELFPLPKQPKNKSKTKLKLIKG